MAKQIKNSIFLFGLIFLGLFLFGCSQPQQSESNANAPAEASAVGSGTSADSEAVFKTVCTLLTTEEISSACGLNVVETETIRKPESDHGEIKYECLYKSIDEAFGGLDDAFYLVLADDTGSTRYYAETGRNTQLEGLSNEAYTDTSGAYENLVAFHNGYYIDIGPTINCPKLKETSPKVELLKKVIARLGG